MPELTMGSLFDGIGGFPLAAVRNGITPLWASEIEPFPIEVTKTHFPDMVQVGDITKLNGADLPPVDIICGGSPCQDCSVASGTRAGLQGARSGLFFEQIRITKELRDADILRGRTGKLVRPQILLLGECPRLLQLRHAARGGFPDCPGVNCSITLPHRINSSTLPLGLETCWGNSNGRCVQPCMEELFCGILDPRPETP